MRVANGLVYVLAMLGTVGCGGSKDPFAGMGDDDAAGVDAGQSGPDAAPGAPDAGAPKKCAPTPKRMIVLGDSITACSVIGGPNGADCVSKQFFDYVKANYAPDLVYENRAVGGALTDGVNQQLAQIQGGPDPVLVMIYVGGNDLAPYIFKSDQEATSAFDMIEPAVVEDWGKFLAFFNDKEKFPGGVTMIMNNQYNPFDDCTASPYNLSETKSNLLHMFNAVLQDIANEAFEHAVLVDQYTPFLGHGHHYNVTTCPHYMAGATPYMKDLIHANAEGNKQLAKVMEGGADLFYRDCTP